MKKVNLYRVVYVGLDNKDKTFSVCAEDIQEASNMAAVILLTIHSELDRGRIKQIQKCKAEPYVESEEDKL